MQKIKLYKKEERVKKACIAFNEGYISAQEIFKRLYYLAYRDGIRAQKLKGLVEKT